MGRGNWMALGVGVASVISCATANWTEITVPADLPEAKRAPQITGVVDMANIAVPLEGTLQLTPGDGVAVIGETLLIQGKSFGRQPTVTIGGRPTTVLSRTMDEGIMVRVPAGTPTGWQPLAVIQERGRDEKTILIRRYAALLPAKSGAVVWAEMTADGASIVNFTPVPASRFLRIGGDGRAAYLVGAEKPENVLMVFDLTAPGQPTIAGTTLLGTAAVRSLLAPANAQTLAVVRDESVLLIDISSPLRPVRLDPRAWPPAVRAGRLRGVEIAPDGNTIAVIVAEKNQVLLVDLARMPRGATAPADNKAVIASLDLAAEVPAPVLADVTFSPDGRMLWVLAGGNAGTQKLGPQATRVFAIRILRSTDGTTRLELARTVQIEAATNPVRLMTAHEAPLSSGASIRVPAEKTTVFVVATVANADGSAVYAVGAGDEAPEVFSMQGKNTLGGIGIVPGGRWLLTPSMGPDGAFRVSSAPANGRPGATRSVTLIPADYVYPDFGHTRPPDIRIQP